MIDRKISAEDPEDRPRATALEVFEEWLDSSRAAVRPDREDGRGTLRAIAPGLRAPRSGGG